MQFLGTYTVVRLSDLSAVAHGQPLPRLAWSPAQWLDPGNLVPGCPAGFAGSGWWPEFEDRASIDPATHTHGPSVWLAPDQTNKRVVLSVPVVAKTQDQIDADAAEAITRRNARAAVLSTQVKVAAEGARLRFVTPGSGKALEYGDKAEEAHAYAAAKAAAAPGDAAVSEALYPWAWDDAYALNGDAAPSDAQIRARLELFLARANAWKVTGRRIAGLEAKAVADIETARAAGDDAAMEAAAVVVAWPTP